MQGVEVEVRQLKVRQMKGMVSMQLFPALGTRCNLQ